MRQPPLFFDKTLFPHELATAKHLPTKHYHRLSATANTQFEILKKIYDLIKNSLKSHPYWLKRMTPYLPIVGVSFGLLSISLQTLLVILDSKSSVAERKQALAFGAIFSSLTLASFALMAAAPAIAMLLGLTLFVASIIVDVSGYMRLLSYQRQLEKHSTPPCNRAQNASREDRVHYEMLLKRREQCLRHFSQALSAHRFNPISEMNKDSTIHLSMQRLMTADSQLQRVERRKELQQSERQRLRLIMPLSHATMAINCVTGGLFMASLLMSSLNPALLGSLITITVCCDIIELTKNIIGYKQQQKLSKQRVQMERRQANTLLIEAATHLNTKQRFQPVLAALQRRHEVLTTTDYASDSLGAVCSRNLSR